MPFNPTMPKRNSFFKPVVQIKELLFDDKIQLPIQPGQDSESTDYMTMKTPQAKNVTFTERAISIHDLTHFYGTDIHGNRDDYSRSMKRAMNKRIISPVIDCWEHAHSYFLKPYNSAFGLVKGALSPLNAALFTFGVMGTLGLFANPYITVAMICAPAMIELLAGIVSLSEALYHKSKAMLTNDQAEHNKASEHFLDATTRFSLTLPLAMICIATFPLEVVRFFTRAIMSLVQLARDLKPAFATANKQTQNTKEDFNDQLENDNVEYSETPFQRA